jgi:hypothetical protein
MVGVYMGDNHFFDVSKFEVVPFHSFLESPERFLAIPAAINQYMTITAFNYINIGRPRCTSRTGSFYLMNTV